MKPDLDFELGGLGAGSGLGADLGLGDEEESYKAKCNITIEFVSLTINSQEEKKIVIEWKR
jgi:hypothetical protein